MLFPFEEGTTIDHSSGSHRSEQVQRGGKPQSWVASLQNTNDDCGHSHHDHVPGVVLGAGSDLHSMHPLCGRQGLAPCFVRKKLRLRDAVLCPGPHGQGSEAVNTSTNPAASSGLSATRHRWHCHPRGPKL